STRIRRTTSALIIAPTTVAGGENINHWLRTGAFRHSIANGRIVTRGSKVVFGIVEISPAIVRDKGVGLGRSLLQVGIGARPEKCIRRNREYFCSRSHASKLLEAAGHNRPFRIGHAI